MRKYNQYILFIFFIGIIASITGCENYREEYYQAPSKSNVKLLDALRENPDFSEYVRYLEITGLDTLLNKPESFTLFIPTNQAFSGFDTIEEGLDRIMGYHIARTVFIPSNIGNVRKLETQIEKFALLTQDETGIYLDGLPVSHNSPLYKDGVYYQLEEVAFPRPNLYEFMDFYNPIFARYVDSRDSISLDYTESTPIDFDEEGNIIYDSVYEVINRFEVDFFPVSVESRDEDATIIMPTLEKYNDALDIMASKLGGDYTDHSDIPVDWQSEFLIPFLFKNGVFEGHLPYEVLITDSLENIQGDMVPVDYTIIDPASGFICSNGYTYDYLDFTIPEELYLEEIKYEGEDLAVAVGGGFYGWNEELVSVSDNTYNPKVFDHNVASEGNYLALNLPRGSSNVYSLEFKLPKIFPRKYKIVWRGNYQPSGVVAFYVNGEYVGEFDNYNFRYPVFGNNPVQGFNQVEFEVNNLTEYNDVSLKMEYQGAGLGSLNGICIDYISLIPVE